MYIRSLAISLVFCSGATAQQSEIAADLAPGLRLGIGWDNLRLTASTETPFESRSPQFSRPAEGGDERLGGGAEVRYQEGQRVMSRLILIEKEEALSEYTDSHSSFGYSNGFTSVNGKASLFRAVQKDSYDLHFLVQVVVTQKGHHLPAPFVFKAAALQELQDDVSEFHKAYGTHFVSEFTVGGEYLAIITVHASSRSEQRSIKSSLNASGLGWGGKASFRSGLAKLSRSTSIQVLEYRAGGAPMETLSGSLGEDAVDEVLQRATLFPKHVSEEPVKIRCTLSKYQGLSDYRHNRSTEWPGEPQKQSFYSVVEKMRQYESRVEDLDFALAHPDAYYEFDKDLLSQVRDEASSTHHDLAKAVRDFCGGDGEGIESALRIGDIGTFDRNNPMPKKYKGFVDGMRLTMSPPTLDGYLLSTHTGGDREINGHDVSVTANAEVVISQDGRSLSMRSKVRVIERKKDWTSFETNNLEPSPFYKAPYGMTIVSVSPQKKSVHGNFKSSKDDYRVLHGNTLLKRVEVLTDTNSKYDTLRFRSMSFGPITIVFAHDEDLEASAPAAK